MPHTAAPLVQIHSRKMNVSPDVNFEELGRSTDDFNAAQLKAVCVEAGMLALRRCVCLLCVCLVCVCVCLCCAFVFVVCVCLVCVCVFVLRACVCCVCVFVLRACVCCACVCLVYCAQIWYSMTCLVRRCMLTTGMVWKSIMRTLLRASCRCKQKRKPTSITMRSPHCVTPRHQSWSRSVSAHGLSIIGPLESRSITQRQQILHHH